MTYTLPDDKREQLIAEINKWLQPNTRFDLHYWQRFVGWYNWALNVYPLLRPALNNIYAKMKGKVKADKSVWVNNAIKSDLRWALDKIENSTGIHLLNSLAWKISEATHVVYCDACLTGLGFWFPKLNVGFYADRPRSWA